MLKVLVAFFLYFILSVSAEDVEDSFSYRRMMFVSLCCIHFPFLSPSSVSVRRSGTAWRSPWEHWKVTALLSAARSAWTWVRAAASSTSTEPLRPAPQQRSGLDNKELYFLKFVSASDWVSRWSWDPPQDLGWRIDCLSWRDRGLSLWSGYTLHQTR